jgi:hypothetical protein
MQRLLTLLVVFGLVSATALPAQATPRQKTRLEYVVTEINPVTGGVVSTTRHASKAAADQQYAALSRAHWVKWRFEGINEPLRFRRFKSSFQAQAFIDANGPSKSGALGFAILTKETRNVPTRMKMTTVKVPVSGGGNGGGNASEVIDTIDRIIGIIDR